MAHATLIQNCELYDGSGDEPVIRDVRIANGIVSDIGALAPLRDEQIIDARGLALMPGIIHLSSALDTVGGAYDIALEREHAASGITTAVVGLGGSSLAPYENPHNTTHAPHGEWKSVRAMLADLSTKPHAINVAHVVGGDALMAHSTPSSALDEALHAGAFGCSFSAGDPFVVGSPEYALAHTTSHQGRSVFWRPPLQNTLARATEHALAFSKTHPSPVVADDVFLSPHAPPSLVQTVLSSLAHAGGQLYALVRSGTSQLFPLPHFSSAHKKLIARMHREHLSPQELHDIDEAYTDFLSWIGSPVITATQKHSSLGAQPLHDIAREWSMDASSALALLNYRHNGGLMLSTTAHPHMSALVNAHDAALPRHSWAPLAVHWKTVPPPNADEQFASLFSSSNAPKDRARIIKKLTAVPAHILSLTTRGRIIKGGEADLILFRPRALTSASRDHAINRVFIHGECLYEEGKHQHPTPGRVLFAA